MNKILQILLISSLLLQLSCCFYDLAAEEEPSVADFLFELGVDYYKKGKLSFILISPRDKSSFLNELGQKTKGLSLQGDRIARPSQ